MDITSSVAFVEARGTALDLARLRHVLWDRRPGPDVIGSLTRRQNDDGGFPPGPAGGAPSAVDGTLTALWHMDELGMLASATADRAIGYLVAVQDRDGGWDEAASTPLEALPPWVRPGDLGTRVYLSAYAAYWLAVCGRATAPAMRNGSAFLLRHQDETGRFRGYLHSTWIATSALLMAGEQYAGPASLGLRYLAGRPLAELADSQIAWALGCLGRAGLASTHPFVEAGLAELVRRRGPDGSWSSEDGDAHAVGATIGALVALRRFGRLAAET